MGGAFDLTQPSLAPKRETGVSSPTTTFRLAFRRDRGVLSTSPNPPSHRNARRRVSSPTTTLRLAFDATGGYFRPLPTLPRIETRDGGFPHPPPPFGSRFDAMGGTFDLPHPSLASKRVVLDLPHPLLAPKRETEGFLTHHHPLARVSPRRRCFRLSLAPKHETGGFPTLQLLFRCNRGYASRGYPLSCACFSHFDARRGSLLHLCSPSSIAYLGIMYII